MGLGSDGPGDVDGSQGWVGGVVAQLADGGSGGHRVLVAGWGGDGQLVWGAGIGPPPVFFALVTAFAEPGGIVPAGGPAVGPGVAVIGIFDGVVAPWGGAGVIADGQHLG